MGRLRGYCEIFHTWLVQHSADGYCIPEDNCPWSNHNQIWNGAVWIPPYFHKNSMRGECRNQEIMTLRMRELLPSMRQQLSYSVHVKVDTNLRAFKKTLYAALAYGLGTPGESSQFDRVVVGCLVTGEGGTPWHSTTYPTAHPRLRHSTRVLYV